MIGVKVYLRGEDDAEGKLLCEVPLAALADESVIDTVGQWGVDADGDVVGRDRLAGQFALDSRGAVFEVMVTGPGE